MSTNNNTEHTTGWSWLGPWVLMMAAIAGLSTQRSPAITVLTLVTIVGGAALCIRDQRDKRRG